MSDPIFRTALPSSSAALGAAAFAAVLWGCLPALKLMIVDLPPFLTAAIALGCAALMETLRSWGVNLRAAGAGEPAAPLSPRRGLVLAACILGAIGFYFIGLDRAPPAQVTMITYVWPLLFVIVSELMTTGRLRLIVILGGALAFAGSAVLILGGGAQVITPDRAGGYIAGLMSGASWVVYSLMLQRGPRLGAEAWPRVFTLAAAVAGLCHVLLETTPAEIAPPSLGVAAAIGTGPYGIAFIAWAYGVGHGPAHTVGTFAYAVPVVATLILVALGATDPSWALVGGAVLVIAGIAVAGRRSA